MKKIFLIAILALSIVLFSFANNKKYEIDEQIRTQVISKMTLGTDQEYDQLTSEMRSQHPSRKIYAAMTSGFWIFLIIFNSYALITNIVKKKSNQGMDPTLTDAN